MLLHLLIALQLPATAPPQDSARALRREAKHAESRYERLTRRLAPRTLGGGSHEPCDEVVGRFCLRFDPDERSTPLPAEAPAAVAARLDAVRRLERAAEAAPRNGAMAGALVRHLVEMDSAGAAVAAARRFAAASPDTAWAPLLLGFALHAAGQDSAAEAYFDGAAARLSEEERRRLRPDVLLPGEERHALGRLGPDARLRYAAALWRLSDPLYLTPGNEVRAEHVARYVWCRILADVPVVTDMTSWGWDLEELTMRYGVPRGRSREVGFGAEPDALIERYDPAALAFVPESLLSVGIRATPPPGTPWPLEARVAHTGYAPATFRLMLPLAPQVSRFPAGDSVRVRIDATLPLDSLPRGVRRVRTALFVLPDDSALLRGDTALRAHVARLVETGDDSAHVALEATLPPGRYIYSIEALSEDGRLALRARHSVHLETAPPPGRPAVSDPLIAAPLPAGVTPAGRQDPRLRPRGGLDLTTGDTIGIYAEVSGLAAGRDGRPRYAVDLWLERLGHPSLPGRAIRWLGRRLGLGSEHRPIRLGWQAEGDDAGRGTVAVSLPLPAIPADLYALHLEVTDRTTGGRTAVSRVVRVLRPR